MKKLHYTPRQRDYTILVTSIVIEAYVSEVSRKYFSYQVNPIFVYIDDGVLWHFMAKEDLRGTGKGWVRTHGTLAKLKKQKAEHDRLLRKYRRFLQSHHKDPMASVLRLHGFFTEALPFLVAIIEVPEYAADSISSAMMNIFMQARKQNDDFYRVGIELQKKLLYHIEQTENIQKNTLANLILPEFDAFLRSGQLPKQAEIKKRNKHFVLKQGRRLLVSSTTKTALKRFGLSLPNAEQGPIHGSIAYRGKVTGKVQVIKNVSDAQLLKTGDILVASMTDPRYVPAMKRAGAIVTDEGGVTSHAAIMARELKVPCIIGTKSATSSFQDGDRVEVDATKGIVRKI